MSCFCLAQNPRVLWFPFAHHEATCALTGQCDVIEEIKACVYLCFILCLLNNLGVWGVAHEGIESLQGRISASGIVSCITDIAYNVWVSLVPTCPLYARSTVVHLTTHHTLSLTKSTSVINGVVCTLTGHLRSTPLGLHPKLLASAKSKPRYSSNKDTHSQSWSHCNC